jgi:hypothetical protein
VLLVVRGDVASTQRRRLKLHDNHQINRLSTLECEFIANEDIVILLSVQSQAMMGVTDTRSVKPVQRVAATNAGDRSDIYAAHE